MSENIRRDMNRPFNRKQADEDKRHREEMKRMFPGVDMSPPPPAPLPDATSRASRPDLFPAFAQGVGSARRPSVRHYDSQPAGNNIEDTNVQSNNQVATDGLADPGTALPDIDRHGRADRPRKQRD